MSRLRIAAVVSVLVGVFAVSGVPASEPAGAQEQAQAGGGTPVVPDSLRARASSRQTIRVIAELRMPEGRFTAERSLAGGAPAIIAQRQQIGDARARVLTALARNSVREVRSYQTVPYVALELDESGLDTLAASPDIVRVMEDRVNVPSLTSSVPHIEGDQLRQASLDGSGFAVAVLDSGIEAAHPFLGGRVVAEACFSSNVAGISESVCPNGEMAEVGPGAGEPCLLDLCYHGTHVAGIVAGDAVEEGIAISGVAPAAQIMSVQVFSNIVDPVTCGGTAPCLGAFSSDLIAGLEHVYATAVAGTLNIAAVNMSLGGGSFDAPCDDEPFKPVIDNLRGINVATVVASGNSFSPVTMSSPGCISTAVSVGSTTLTDQVSEFSNVTPFLSLFAPGDAIISSFPGGGYEILSGTSMATPHVAGAWAVIRQGAPTATVDDVLGALQGTGLPVTDLRFWAPGTTTVPRVQLFQALSTLAPITNPVPQLSSVTPPNGRAGVPLTLTLTGAGFNAFSVALWNGEPIPTVTNSVTQLTAVVPSSLLVVGASLVSVTNPSPGGGATVPLEVIISPPPSLTVDKTAAAPGTPVTVTLEDGFGGTLDWLAIAPAGSPDSTFLQSVFVGAGIEDRTWTVNLPATPGDYEFRLFLNNTFQRAATSPVVTADASISPVPVVTSMTPTSRLAGTAGFDLVVNGTKFVAGSVVQWNGQARPTTFVNTSQLRAAIPASDLAVAGGVSVSVFTPEPGGGTSATLPFTVVAAPQLSVDATEVAPGSQVTVTLTNGLGNNLDFLTLSASGAAENSYLQFTYVGAGVTTRTWTVTMPATPGDYEFRLFKQGAFVRLATSATVTVEAPPAPELTVSATEVAPGDPVTVTLTNGLGGGTDWLAFAATGAADNGHVAWIYVGAGVTERTWTVTAPSTPGTYEFRLYKQASYVRLATSDPVTVAGPPVEPDPVLTVSATTAVTGSQVTVTLTGGTGHATDWIAFSAVGAPASSFVQLVYVGWGVTTRTWTVTVPSSAGAYEFRLFGHGSYTLLATSPTVTVTPPPDPTLTVDTTSASPGQAVTVTLTGGPGNNLDWLALASTSAANNSYVKFTYVGAGVTTRTWTVNAPTTPGTYEFRLFKNGSFVRLATSATITVAPPPPPTLTVSTTTAAPGEQVTVTLTNGLGGSLDWLAFAPVGAAANSYSAWTYVGAGVTTRTWTVTMPSAPGTYEFRLFRQGSFQLVTVSVGVVGGG